MNIDAINRVRSAKCDYEVAKDRGMGFKTQKEKYLNVLFNNAGALLEAIDEHEGVIAQMNLLVEENQRMAVELSAAKGKGKAAPSKEEKKE